ncbi:MerR family transcriptional regulator [Prauserella marina]|uniref:DNA-binding transcriptional regulator, MerR family n=1 Tax=Prauserella marina TaxID=530584 RepID=A0A222VP17_9PSEU|nr:MerR family transcriptional regulator [Prauserella marina]ASR35666.1 MerR family transcriptional regulator [Prauserella marina]PWV84459.1 DNA-binding transcriptional MerR regulator [Prauserella marina]SDC22029.1 DNA-binding transcriptional regulator, MerR family [Prauserella marina]
MAWSTREVAQLAGTTLRAVRHYHEVGLLDEPERAANGYKRYGVAHLVRILRIKRLTALGFSLSRIADMGEAEEHSPEALDALDEELAATIERLQRVRAEIAVLRRNGAPTDLPPELATVAEDAELDSPGRALLTVMAQVVSPSTINAYTNLLRTEPSGPETAEFDALPADADESTRQELALRLVAYGRELRARHPELREPLASEPSGPHDAARTIDVAINELYNAAQRDVLLRVRRLRADTDEPG